MRVRAGGAPPRTCRASTSSPPLEWPPVTTAAQTVVSVALLGSAIWALIYLLPRARREQDGFGVLCAWLMAILGVLAWLFAGVGMR